MANGVDPDQTAPIRAVCSEFTLFASIPNLSVMFGSYLQQTTSVDDFSNAFLLGAFNDFLNFLTLLGNFACFFCRLLSKYTFSRKILSGILSECQTV